MPSSARRLDEQGTFPTSTITPSLYSASFSYWSVKSVATRSTTLYFNSCTSWKICKQIQNEYCGSEKCRQLQEASELTQELAGNPWFMNSPTSLKWHLRIALPFKAEELGLKCESCRNLDMVKVRTNVARCHLGLVFSCQRHRAACWEMLHTGTFSCLTSFRWSTSLRKRPYPGTWL